MQGFNQDGARSNEYSTASNPWGIMHHCDYYILSAVVAKLELRSSRNVIKLADLRDVFSCECNKANVLKNEIRNLESQPFDLGRKITIDNKYILFNAISSGCAIFSKVLDFVPYFKVEDYYTRQRRCPVDKVTLSDLVRTYTYFTSAGRSTGNKKTITRLYSKDTYTSNLELALTEVSTRMYPR